MLVEAWLQFANSTNKYALPDFFAVIVDPINSLNVTLFLEQGYDDEKSLYIGSDIIISFRGVVE